MTFEAAFKRGNRTLAMGPSSKVEHSQPIAPFLMDAELDETFFELSSVSWQFSILEESLFANVAARPFMIAIVGIHRGVALYAMRKHSRMCGKPLIARSVIFPNIGYRASLL